MKISYAFIELSDYHSTSLTFSSVISLVCILLHVCVHTCNCTCMWRLEVDSRYFIWLFSVIIFETGLPYTLDHWFSKTNYPVSSWDLRISIPRGGLHMCPVILSFCRVLGSELRPPFLHSGQFSNWAISWDSLRIFYFPLSFHVVMWLEHEKKHFF